MRLLSLLAVVSAFILVASALRVSREYTTSEQHWLLPRKNALSSENSEQYTFPKCLLVNCHLVQDTAQRKLCQIRRWSACAKGLGFWENLNRIVHTVVPDHGQDVRSTAAAPAEVLLSLGVQKRSGGRAKRWQYADPLQVCIRARCQGRSRAEFYSCVYVSCISQQFNPIAAATSKSSYREEDDDEEEAAAAAAAAVVPGNPRREQ